MVGVNVINMLMIGGGLTSEMGYNTDGFLLCVDQSSTFLVDNTTFINAARQAGGSFPPASGLPSRRQSLNHACCVHDGRSLVDLSAQPACALHVRAVGRSTRLGGLSQRLPAPCLTTRPPWLCRPMDVSLHAAGMVRNSRFIRNQVGVDARDLKVGAHGPGGGGGGAV